MDSLLDRLREQRCDREPFTPDHARCVCRLTNEAADEIETLIGREREKVAQWMIANGLTTGHGDTMEDLLAELTRQIEELRGNAIVLTM